jgi:Ca-activated chloride channel homolog
MYSKIAVLSLLTLLASCTNIETPRDEKQPVSPAESPQIQPTQPIKQVEEDLYSTYELKKDKVELETRTKGVTVEAPQMASDSSALAMNSAAPMASRGIGAGAAKSFTGNAKMMREGRMYYPAPSLPIYTESIESYDSITENSFHDCLTNPLSTFSIDVDTASYSNMRRMIVQGSVPNKDSIRVEELINYFNYDDQAPTDGAFAVNMEVAPSLWNKKHRVVRIGIKGKEIKTDQRPASNLVFLIDVSGSMDSADKLPLVKSSLGMLVDKLNKNDKISIVVYAGAAGTVLEPTTGDKKLQILRALDHLKAGGSTNGSDGIELAYKLAKENFIKGGVNRVILATDGDFNVGTTDRESLIKLVEKNAKENVYVSILGFGMGNYKDGMMESLSNKGNGNYAYIDTMSEARKVMVEQMSGTLVTIAKDVKLQVEFNPKFVQSYRLVGYEDRVLKNEDFNNDAKDAGDIGAGHTVTALYEIVPVGEKSSGKVDALKYQKVEASEKQVQAFESSSDELLTLKIRYKKPDGNVSAKQEFTLMNQQTKTFENSSEAYRFSSAVALFGMLLRQSEYVQDGTFKDVLRTAKKSQGEDKNQYRQEFIELVGQVESLKKNTASAGPNYYE